MTILQWKLLMGFFLLGLFGGTVICTLGTIDGSTIYFLGGLIVMFLSMILTGEVNREVGKDRIETAIEYEVVTGENLSKLTTAELFRYLGGGGDSGWTIHSRDEWKEKHPK